MGVCVCVCVFSFPCTITKKGKAKHKKVLCAHLLPLMIEISFLFSFGSFTTFLFLQLSGVAVLGVGIWILVDPDLQDYIDVIHVTDEEYFKYAAYILIAFGAFVLVVGFCGCCGAIRNSKCMLGFVSD